MQKFARYITCYSVLSGRNILNKTHPFGPLSFLLEDLGRKLAPIITYIVAIDTVTAITTAAVLISLNDEIIFHLQDLIITVASPLFCSSKSVWKSSWWHIFKQSARKSVCRVVYFRRIARIRRKIAPLFHTNNQVPRRWGEGQGVPRTSTFCDGKRRNDDIFGRSYSPPG